MTTRDQLIRARIGILAMAGELKNIARACKLAGVSRSQFYAMKKAYALYGKDGLAPRARRKPEMPNRTPAQLEVQILLETRKHPLISYVRLAGEMQSEGGTVTPTTVRYVWRRHGLSTKSARRAWAKLWDAHSMLQGAEDVSSESFDKPLQDGKHKAERASTIDRALAGPSVPEL